MLWFLLLSLVLLLVLIVFVVLVLAEPTSLNNGLESRGEGKALGQG